MAQYAVPQYSSQPVETPTTTHHVASPAPLGLGMIGILTAIVGCFYTGFITPFQATGIRTALAPVLLIGGLILVLAGMWEFRKGYMMTATTFTSYGGFLAILGWIFLPSSGVLTALGGNAHLFLGLLFLCWTIFLGVLCLGALRTNVSLATTLVVLFAAYLLLMLGSFANNNSVLLKVGGWLAIASALIAWLASLASILSTSSGREAFNLPFSDRLAVVEDGGRRAGQGRGYEQGGSGYEQTPHPQV
ncbi:MAG TPA: acetate uptake transporter [Ktedonobacteraceae bacterium]|nr:acetate uptake transporter [Ktedonobacteraceae bacterium]